MSRRSHDSPEVEPLVPPPPGTPDYRVDPVPKVPHRSSWRWAARDLFRIGFLGALLVMVIMARKACSNGVANFVDSFSPPDAGMHYERLTPEEIRKRFPDHPSASPNDAPATKDAAKDAAKDATNSDESAQGDATMPAEAGQTKRAKPAAPAPSN